MAYLFTSESVSEGHPDKVADQISDAMLDEFLRHDPHSKVACETFCTTGLVVVGGEITSGGEGKVNVDKIVRATVEKIGYTKASYKFDSESCGVISAIHQQSSDILQGVESDQGLHKEQGAGDQGMMFGYATTETENYMPLALDLSHRILQVLADLRREGNEISYLRPDAKAQVTIEYSDDNVPQRIDSIVVSTQHDDFSSNDEEMLAKIKNDIVTILIPRVKAQLSADLQALFTDEITYHINPTGKFVIGGPHGDTGLTGRKIIVDTYGGKGAHGGGAFSGKDPSKVDRSAAYMCRWVAKNVVAAGLAEKAELQVAYAIGHPHPVSVSIDTFGTNTVAEEAIEKAINEVFSFKPADIISQLDLLRPIYKHTTNYGHFGREDNLSALTWEKTNMVDALKGAL